MKKLQRVRMKRKTEEQLLDELRLSTRVQGGISRTAKDLGFSAPFISDVEKGLVPITERLANAMGYERRIVFERET